MYNIGRRRRCTIFILNIILEYTVLVTEALSVGPGENRK
jgi:hypothetical protein